jgi:hypothetical protein
MFLTFVPCVNLISSLLCLIRNSIPMNLKRTTDDYCEFNFVE